MKKKIEVTLSASEAVQKNKGHHQKKVTSTYTISSSNERGPGNIPHYFSCQQVQGSWGNTELMRALVHKKGWFLRPKAHNLRISSLKGRNRASKLQKIMGVKMQIKMWFFLSCPLGHFWLISGKTGWTQEIMKKSTSNSENKSRYWATVRFFPALKRLVIPQLLIKTPQT